MGWCTVRAMLCRLQQTALWGRAVQLEARQARRRLQLSTQESLLRAGQECFNTEHEHKNTALLPISPAAFWRWGREVRGGRGGGCSRCAKAEGTRSFFALFQPLLIEMAAGWWSAHGKNLSLFLLAPKKERGKKKKKKEQQQQIITPKLRHLKIANSGRLCTAVPVLAQTALQLLQ